MKEEAVLFGSRGSLTGVITEPSAAGWGKALPGFVFLNAGMTHRIGPNRLYVRLARDLAAAGFATMRFDFSGLGDSGVRTDDLPAAKAVVVETQEAMDCLAHRQGCETFVLIGICSGAAISYLTAREDRRVVGAVLINAQGHLHGSDLEVSTHLRARAMARHSWRIAFFSSFRSKNWRKAVVGQLNPLRILRMMVGFPLQALRGRGKSQESLVAHDPVAEMRALDERGVRLYHVYCEADEGLDYLHVVLGGKVEEVTSRGGSRFELIRGANHVFTTVWSQEHLQRSVVAWARTLAAPA